MMIPNSNLVSFPDESYLTDNLLDDSYWTRDFTLNVNHSISQSNEDQFQLIDEYSSSSQYDFIETLFSGETNLYATQKDFQQDDVFVSPHGEVEDVSMLSNDLSPETEFSLPAKQNIPVPKVPISRLKTKSDLSSAGIAGSCINDSTLGKAVITDYAQNRFSQNAVSSNEIKPIIVTDIQNSESIDKKSFIKQEACVPFLSPSIVKLENGQVFVARSIKKPKVMSATSLSHDDLKNGINKRNSEVKIESIHTLSRDLNALKKYKRQQRMIKNRESACLSRQRKKEQLKALEMRVNEITSMNENLKKENESLKQRIQSLENENTQLRRKSLKDINIKNKAVKSSVLFVVVLIFIFKGFGASTDILEPAPYKNELSLANEQLIYHSRSLLQLTPRINPSEMDVEYYLHTHRKPYNANSMNDLYNNAKKDSGSLKIKKRRKIVNFQSSEVEHISGVVESHADCGEQFNETYLNRINNALNGLVKDLNPGKEELMSMKKYAKRKKSSGGLMGNSSFIRKISKPKSRNCSHSNASSHASLHFIKNYKIDKVKRIIAEKRYSQLNLTSQDLANAVRKSIQRRSDTFYVVTLWKDFLVLPRTNNSNSNRPKVSFIIPAFHPNNNETLKKSNKLTMLQIDCNVIDAKLIELNQSLISKSLLTQVN